MQIKKLQYGVLLLPLGFAVVALATLVQGATALTASNKTLPLKAETVETTIAPAEVTINGQHVDVPENGTAVVKDIGGGHATVQSVSSGSDTKHEKTTSVTRDSDNGNLNVTVSNSNTNRTGFSYTSVSSFSSNQSGSNSVNSTQVNTSGTGQVTVSK